MELNRGIIDLGIYSLFDGTAKYKRSFTYKDLKKNWLDDRSIPSEKAIKDAYMLEIEKINRQNKIKAKYKKELDNLIWKEVKKNKDNDLDTDDLIEVDKKIK